MSVAEKTEQLIPVGTWKSDPVHSTVGFAVKHHVVATFRGKFTELRGDARRRRGAEAHRRRQGDEHRRRGREPVRPPPVARLLRRRALSRSFASSRAASAATATAFVADAELTVKGVTRPVTVTGTIAGPITDPYGGERLGLTLETTIDRTAVRDRLERAPSRRRPRRLQRRRAPRRARARQGAVGVRILAVSGSLRRESYNTRLLRAAAELAPAGIELELYDGLASLPPYDADLDVEPAPATVRDLRERISRCRRGPDLDARVQRLDPGTAEERDRLGLAALPRELAAQQADRARGRHSGRLRRDVGTDRPAQGARRDRRPRGRRGAPGGPGGNALRRRGSAHRPRPTRAPDRAPRAARGRGAPGACGLARRPEKDEGRFPGPRLGH